MNTLLQEQSKTVFNPLPGLPIITVIQPFRPTMVSKNVLTTTLLNAGREAEAELLNRFNKQISSVVLNRLRKVIDNLNYHTHKRSIAIFVSPYFEKVFYLNMDMIPKVSIDTHYDIRELINSKKKSEDYLVLKLSKAASRLFLGTRDGLRRLATIAPQPALLESSKQLTGTSLRPDSHINYTQNFLEQLDNSLGFILEAYPLPLFVTGRTQLIAAFRKITRHNNSVVDCIPTKNHHRSNAELIAIIDPGSKQYDKLMELHVCKTLCEADSKNRLSTGIERVWKDAKSHRSQLLVVEKDYSVPMPPDPAPGDAFRFPGTSDHQTLVTDLVDRIIETVIEDGGDVHFVENNSLSSSDRIALVKKY